MNLLNAKAILGKVLSVQKHLIPHQDNLLKFVNKPISKGIVPVNLFIEKDTTSVINEDRVECKGKGKKTWQNMTQIINHAAKATHSSSSTSQSPIRLSLRSY